MNTTKEKAIRKILKNFEEFSLLILNQLSLLEKVLKAVDGAAADEVVEQIKANEKAIDRFEITLSERIVNTIVLYNPVAGDLRKIIACYRMISNLERIGDLVYGIVRVVRTIEEEQLYKEITEMIHHMFMVSSTMVTRSLLSFINGDKELAIWTIKKDAMVDELNEKLVERAVQKSGLDEQVQRKMMGYIQMKSIVSSVERIADHASNIAEATIYSLEGSDIRHQEIEE